MLGVVGSNLKMVKFEPTAPNKSQQGSQTHTTCCDMLSLHVAIVWPGLNFSFGDVLVTVAVVFCVKVPK